MKINKDTLWAYGIVIAMFLYLMLMSIIVSGQTKVDSILYNHYKNSFELISKQHKQRITELEDPEKYQMIYIDKAIIDRKNHKIYLYSSYDLYWAEELGATWQITIPHKKQIKTKQNGKLRLSRKDP